MTCVVGSVVSPSRTAARRSWCRIVFDQPWPGALAGARPARPTKDLASVRTTAGPSAPRSALNACSIKRKQSQSPEPAVPAVPAVPAEVRAGPAGTAARPACSAGCALLAAPLLPRYRHCTPPALQARPPGWAGPRAPWAPPPTRALSAALCVGKGTGVCRRDASGWPAPASPNRYAGQGRQDSRLDF